MGKDTGIREHLNWVATFVQECGSVIDAVSWHTYDYRTSDFGAEDHHPLPFPPTNPNVSHLYDPQYWDVAGRLADDISDIVAAFAPGKPIWLSETNSINHQGVFNVSNAFFNSLWLVNRFGLMAERGTPLMSRQSLIGYNYSLLGNFPVEPIFAAPDYYTTVLFKRLAGTTVLPLWRAGGSGRLRSFAFCSQSGQPGGVMLALVNTDDTHEATATVELGGDAEIYELSPGWPQNDFKSPPSFRATSRHIALNGNVLSVSLEGDLPSMLPRTQRAPAAGQPTKLTLEPLTIMFAVFPDARAEACSLIYV